MFEEKIEMVAIDKLRPWTRNPRTHPKIKIQMLAEGMDRYGFTVPILVDENNFVLAGWARVLATKSRGETAIRCIRIATLTPVEKRAYVIFDNRIAELAGWDDTLLAQELIGIREMDPEFNCDLTGFSAADIDGLMDDLVPQQVLDPKDDRIPKDAPRRCRRGDIFQLGHHRLACGDALDPAIVEALMGGERAHMVFTDPPYNVRITGNVSGKGRVRHGEFAMASGEMSREQFTTFLKSACSNIAEVVVDGAIVFLCMDWRHMREIEDAAGAVFGELKNLIVWAKDNGGMGTFYRSRHELIFVYKHGTAKHQNNFELGQFGRYRTNVWEYAGANTRKAGRLEELALHPTTKPVQMVADAIKDVSPRGGIVLDLFGGSGSTLIAAHKVGRRARLVEYDPRYCDRIIYRWELYAKDRAERIACGVRRTGDLIEADETD
jgi:DNA modification methylase